VEKRGGLVNGAFQPGKGDGGSGLRLFKSLPTGGESFETNDGRKEKGNTPEQESQTSNCVDITQGTPA